SARRRLLLVLPPKRRTPVRTQRLLASLTLVAMALVFRGSFAVTALGAQDGSAGRSSYVVVYAQGANAAEARAALAAVGATVVKENTAIGVATVESSGDLLSLAGSIPSLLGAARNRPVGRLPDRSVRKLNDADLDRLDTMASAPAQRPESGSD